MNRTQWFVLAFGFMLIGIYFVSMDFRSPTTCEMLQADSPLTTSDVWCVINTEMFDPFISLLFPLVFLCLILGWLEPKNK